MRYVLGVDQGGSKTHVIIADENGNVLGMGKSYGACHSSTSVDYAIQAIVEASEQAFLQSGICSEDIKCIVGGLTGIDWDYEAELLEKAIQEKFPSTEIYVVNDSIIAMRAATQESKCGILCAGSGLNCAVQNGNECFVYGFYIPDEYQGGWSLGKRALQAVFDAHMGLSEETTLTERLLEYFHVDSVDELLFWHVKEKITEKQYLFLPQILEEEANKGDKISEQIWVEYGETIAKYLTARAVKMGVEKEKMDIVLSGSVFKCKFKKFQQTVEKEILKKVPNASMIDAKYEPIMGAMFMALEKINGTLTEACYMHAEETSKQYPLRRIVRN